jgi:uncharacterized iron-regulated membrane protein
MRKFFVQVHLWLSVPAGLIISLVCLTGAILSFDKEILELVYPEWYFVEKTEGVKPLSPEKLVLLANEQLEDNSVASIQIQSDPERTYTLGLKEGFRVSAFINPNSGEITGIYHYRESFFYKIMALHRWLMDGSRTVGKVTVGVSTVFFVFILLTGIIVWFPQNKRLWKNGFRVYFRYGVTRFLRDIHITLGMYAFLLLLICSLTGLMWSFEGYRNTVFGLFGVEAQQGGHRGSRTSNENTLDISNWDEVYSHLAAANPGYQYIRIQDKSATVLAADAAHSRATDKYSFNAETGEVTSKELYSKTKSTSKIMTWAYALHVGSYWGIFGRFITFLASLIGATLPFTGYYIWFVRKRAVYRNKKEMDNLL